jgi:hypothetical protein
VAHDNGRLAVNAHVDPVVDARRECVAAFEIGEVSGFVRWRAATADRRVVVGQNLGERRAVLLYERRTPIALDLDELLLRRRRRSALRSGNEGNAATAAMRGTATSKTLRRNATVGLETWEARIVARRSFRTGGM